ncbi:MAG: dioxygenase family protein [Segniliparus sp.]|uniref:dioxygenase family protein n=1 Tax=Segniliparus sp. TaxID=2804064 RepID=UPI003F31CF3F
MPALFLSHGAPPLADDATWTDELARLSASLPRPEAVLMVSAHWEAAPITLGAVETKPLVYDFWGFPQRYYEVVYEAPGAPALAESVRKLLGGEVREEPERGLDHGAYVPLKEMYPAADVPVLQLSMPALDPWRLFEVGRALAPLREQGVLIVGSGFTTHNLSLTSLASEPDSAPPSWSREFDDWTAQQLAAGEVDALLDFQRKAPAARLAHPRTEHFAPLFVALGSASDARGRTVVDGFWHGLAKRSALFD